MGKVRTQISLQSFSLAKRKCLAGQSAYEYTSEQSPTVLPWLQVRQGDRGGGWKRGSPEDIGGARGQGEGLGTRNSRLRGLQNSAP